MEFFSFRGRVNRSTNLLTQIALNVTGWVLGTISATLVNGQQFVSIFLGLLMIGGLWIGLATYVKRAHDVGRSALFAVSPWLVQMFVLPIGLKMEEGFPVFSAMAILSSVMYLFAAILWVTFKAGDPETNRYGEAPPPPPSAQRANAPMGQPKIDD